jgi:hypothetical protein
MEFVADRGSSFDASVEDVWRYLQSETDLGNSHKGRRNFERTALNESTAVRSWEQEIDGKWIRMSNRLTFHPPVGFLVEPLEGPMAGSKFFNYYIPKGEKTEVAVVGEWASKTIPPAQLEQAVMANLEKVFHEDSVGLKEFTSKK